MDLVATVVTPLTYMLPMYLFVVFARAVTIELSRTYTWYPSTYIVDLCELCFSFYATELLWITTHLVTGNTLFHHTTLLLMVGVSLGNGTRKIKQKLNKNPPTNLSDTLYTLVMTWGETIAIYTGFLLVLATHYLLFM